ncbi:MAG: type II secretion system protein GspM [Bryobacteraceae bacterium]|jgi:hypothetical protein
MNRRALYLLLIAMVVLVIVRYGFFSGPSAPAVVPAQDSIPVAEKRLENTRRAAAALPAKEELYKKAAADLAEREKSLLNAGNQQQAEVALLQKVQEIASANQIDVRGNQGFREKPLTGDYGEVTVLVAFSCGMDQLVNFLTAIANQPETLATDEIHVAGGGDPKKNVQVRLSVSAAVPRKILAEKKGVASF